MENREKVVEMVPSNPERPEMLRMGSDSQSMHSPGSLRTSRLHLRLMGKAESGEEMGSGCSLKKLICA